MTCHVPLAVMLFRHASFIWGQFRNIGEVRQALTSMRAVWKSVNRLQNTLLVGNCWEQLCCNPVNSFSLWGCVVCVMLCTDRVGKVSHCTSHQTLFRVRSQGKFLCVTEKLWEMLSEADFVWQGIKHSKWNLCMLLCWIEKKKKVSLYVLMQAIKFKKKRNAKRMFAGRATLVFGEILGVVSTPASWGCCLGYSFLIIFFI